MLHALAFQMDPWATKTTEAKESKLDEFKKLEVTLPKEMWFGVYPMHLYQEFWCFRLELTISFQTHFQAHDTDIILASMPKTGTTWLKSLLFSIINRKNYPNISQHPLLTMNPHELIHHFEFKIYDKINGPQQDLTQLPSPRLFATHIPYSSLPSSIKSSNCRLVYICRNPFDTFVSLWLFSQKLDNIEGVTPDTMEDYFGKFCEGKCPFGPYEDHVLGYWKESKVNPKKVLFSEYEGLKGDPKGQAKRLAEFVGHPFSEEEENEGVVEEILKLCSIDNLKNMDVNKSGRFYSFFENKALFREGKVGDWKNHLTPSMVERLDKFMEEKFKGFDFSFKKCQTIDPPS